MQFFDNFRLGIPFIREKTCFCARFRIRTGLLRVHKPVHGICIRKKADFD